MTKPTNILEGPTYIAVRSYPDGEVWIQETKLNATLQDAIEDIDGLFQVVMLESGKAFDVTVEAAELYWALHGHEIETMFAVPPFLHDNIADQVYSEISRIHDEARCWHEQQVSCNPRVL